MPKSSTLAFAGLFLFTFAPVIARGDSWMPLAIGTRWEYVGSGGVHQVETITGPTSVRGRTVAVKSYTVGPDDGLQNFWLLDPDGSVLLAGFFNPSAGLALAYEPPVRFLPVPPDPGTYPVQHIVAHDLLTDAVVDAFDIQIGLTGSVVLTLPAGTYVSVGVGQVAPPAVHALGRGNSLALDGRRVSANAPSASPLTPSDWFSYGVGDVMYQTTDLFQLVGFGLPTATASTSWGALKRLYH